MHIVHHIMSHDICLHVFWCTLLLPHVLDAKLMPSQLDTVADPTHVLLVAVEKGGPGAIKPILLRVFHSCFPCTVLKDCFAKTAFWVRK